MLLNFIKLLLISISKLKTLLRFSLFFNFVWKQNALIQFKIIGCFFKYIFPPSNRLFISCFFKYSRRTSIEKASSSLSGANRSSWTSIILENASVLSEYSEIDLSVTYTWRNSIKVLRDESFCGDVGVFTSISRLLF